MNKDCVYNLNSKSDAFLIWIVLMIILMIIYLCYIIKRYKD